MTIYIIYSLIIHLLHALCSIPVIKRRGKIINRMPILKKKILKPKSPFFMICHFYLNFSCSINTDAVKFNYYIYTFDLLKWHIFCCCFILTFFFLDIQKKSNLQERCHDFFMQDKTNDNLIIIFSYILLY